jgi:beta-glucuronidase
MSEFGAEAEYGNHGALDQRWSEEQQANVFQHQFVMLHKIPQLRGVAPWILVDFRSNNRNIPQLQDGYNRKGLISEQGEKKQSFELFRKMYADHAAGRAD